jgi:pyruvate formate lyase activating enzyme
MILDNLKKLSRARASIIVRIPLIPGVNDDEENIIQSASFLSTLPHLLGVELMPYHEIGLAKYQGLGMNYRFNQLKPISLQHIQEVEQIIYNYHLPILKDSPGRII